MSYIIEDVLNDEVLQEQQILIGEYKFYLGEIPKRITIKLYKQLGGTNIAFEQSHFIHTPIQAGPYRTDHDYGDYEAYALHLAINTLTKFYNEAIQAGHTPDESWLIENINFS